MDNKPANDEQILVMWQLAKGHVIRFARLLESYHGIGGIKDEGDKDIVTSRSSCAD